MFTANASAQLKLIRGNTNHIEVATFILVNDLSKPNTEYKLINFVGECDNCPTNLVVDSDTEILQLDKDFNRVAKTYPLLINNRYRADAISYDKDTFLVKTITLDKQ
jgi:hypothetical protein